MRQEGEEDRPFVR